jgi:hypothetical protein
MKRVLSKAATLRRRDLTQFLAISAGTPSGFRLLIGAWVVERAEGVERFIRSTYIWLAIGAIAVLAVWMSPPAEPDRPSALAILASLAVVVALSLAAWSGFQMRRAQWFRRQQPEFHL